MTNLKENRKYLVIKYALPNIDAYIIRYQDTAYVYSGWNLTLTLTLS